MACQNFESCYLTCAGHEAGSEVAVHAMKELFGAATSEAALVDATNAFNCVSRQAALHNISQDLSIIFYHPAEYLSYLSPSFCCW